MRAHLYSFWSLATILSTALAHAPLVKREAAPTGDDWEDKVPDTIFNGQTVPPMQELGTDLNEVVKQGNWLVEFFHPQCPHCTRFKPTWQTLYEFYYTTKPLATTPSTDDNGLNSFTRYYDFKFAKVDCMAYADACVARGVDGYPSILQIKDGKEVKKMKGEQTLPDLSGWIEGVLESVRPGSRPQGGPKLPKVGANAVEKGPETATEATENKPALSDSAKAAQSVSSKPTKPTSAKALSSANPSGVSEILTPEKFQNSVTNTLEPWFIKFYAPWCHHCQAMAPNWAAMAREMQGKLNVGEVNCEEERRLCKDAGVKGYPTVLFFRGGERTEYMGLRGVGDLTDYAKKAVVISAGVADVTAAEFDELEKTEDVIFVYHYDDATTSEDFKALEQLTLGLVGQALLVKTKDRELSTRHKVTSQPRFVVSRSGKVSSYPPNAPKDMRDSKKVLAWMKSVWLPLLPELKSENANDIMDGKIVVLGILSRDRPDQHAAAVRELKSAAMEWIEKEEKLFELERKELRDAKQMRIEEAQDKNDQRALRDAKQIRIEIDETRRRRVGFAWVDGVFWERWIKTTYGIDVKDGERVVINDEANHRYWDATASSSPIALSRATILETLTKVINSPSELTGKSTISSWQAFYLSSTGFVTGHPFLSLGAVLCIFVAAWWSGRGSRRRWTGYGTTGGYYQNGEKGSGPGLGLLGGASSFGALGKTD